MASMLSFSGRCRVMRPWTTWRKKQPVLSRSDELAIGAVEWAAPMAHLFVARFTRSWGHHHDAGSSYTRRFGRTKICRAPIRQAQGKERLARRALGALFSGTEPRTFSPVY